MQHSGHGMPIYPRNGTMHKLPQFHIDNDSRKMLFQDAGGRKDHARFGTNPAHVPKSMQGEQQSHWQESFSLRLDLAQNLRHLVSLTPWRQIHSSLAVLFNADTPVHVTSTKKQTVSHVILLKKICLDVISCLGSGL